MPGTSTLLSSATHNYSKSQRARAAAELYRRKKKRLAAKRELWARGLGHRPTFYEFIEVVNPRLLRYAHVLILVAVLDRVPDDDLDRAMVSEPPRHFKSEVVSRLFPAYYLYLFPERWVGLASYSANLAYTLSRNARDYYTEAGGKLSKSGAEQWETGGGGGMWAAGVGGPITGMGFSLGIVDDPVKNAEEAASETIREKHKDWWRSTFYTRQAPGAAIIVIQTRWHEDDLSGWLLSQEGDEDADPERWHIVNMPAIKEEPEEEHKFPSTCTVEPDPRQPGEALCPDRYPIAKIKRFARALGEYFFGALYQQRPRPLSGGMFDRKHFEIVPAPPNTFQWVRYWDKAVSKSATAKYSAGVLLALGNDGIIYICDVVRGQWNTAERRKVMLETAKADHYRHGDYVRVFIEQEPGSSGVDSVYDEIRLLSPYPTFADRPSGDKDTRMLPLAAQAQIGNVRLVQGDWNEPFIQELIAIPNGRYRDQADAAGAGYVKLVEGAGIEANAGALLQAFGLGKR